MATSSSSTGGVSTHTPAGVAGGWGEWEQWVVLRMEPSGQTPPLLLRHFTSGQQPGHFIIHADSIINIQEYAPPVRPSTAARCLWSDPTHQPSAHMSVNY